MKNTKLIATLIAISTVFAASARCWIDRDGYRNCDRYGVVENTVGTAGDVAGDTVDVAGETASVLNPLNWGERGRERREERRERRDARRGRNSQ
jgi:hypothetical protein